MHRPLIAATTSTRTGWRVYPFIWLAIRLAGGRSVRWTTARPADLSAVDGLIIGGGDDISPELYGGHLIPTARLDPQRDEMESELVRVAIERNIPVLGICRGAQMINVASGGTLNQTAYESYQESRYFYTILPKKTVILESGTRLAAASGMRNMEVNALHSQSVDQLGHDLQTAAHDTGGMVQAIERTRDPFAIGVQWHPEYLIYAKRQRALFRALVAAARAYHEARRQLHAVDVEAREA